MVTAFSSSDDQARVVRRGGLPKRSVSLVVAALLLAAIGVPALASADPLQWSITPYVWAPDTKVDVRANGTPVGSGKVTFNDLLDTLDAAFQLHVEAGRGEWGGLLDITSLDTSDNTSFGPIRIDTESTMEVIDAAAVWWPEEADGKLSMLMGVRESVYDDKFKFRLAGTPVGNIRSDNDYTDVLVGVRYRWDIAPRWQFSSYGDYSFGDSEGTWQLRGLFRYAIGAKQRYGIVFGYQYKEAEFKDGSLKTKFEYYGPIAGFESRF